MILEFSVTNFRSIKDKQTFSMLPSNRVKERKNPLLNVEHYQDLAVLPVALIYGKNNAGKSNLLKAFYALKWLVLNSYKFTHNTPLSPNENFLFDLQTQQTPTEFEIDFIATDKKRYLYSIELNKSEILREELHYYKISPKGKLTKRQLFIRHSGKPIRYGDDFKGAKKSIEERLIENILFLSKAVHENNQNLRSIFDFFEKKVSTTDMSQGYIDFHLRYYGKVISGANNADMLEAISNALRSVDTDILRLEVKKDAEIPYQYTIADSNSLNEKDKKIREEILDTLKHSMQTIHRLFDGKQEVGEQPLPLSEESEGTRKFVALFSKIMDMGKNGGVFIVDELERSLHPILTKILLPIFSNPITNPKQAQIIFTSHDATLQEALDNDQINLLEKDKYGATEIYTVSDIRGLRNGASIEKRYLSGQLGGIPNINLYQITKNLDQLYEENAEV